MTKRVSGSPFVFRGAIAVALLHALDDAFLNRQPGVALDQHALAAVISLGPGIGAIVAFPRLRPGFRAAIALAFGVLAIVNGTLHVAHISVDGAAASDYTGVFALAAGASLAAPSPRWRNGIASPSTTSATPTAKAAKA